MPGLSEHPVHCPCCGERIDLLVDDSAGAQEYVEDCPVCCRPIAVGLSAEAGGDLRVEVRSEYGAGA